MKFFFICCILAVAFATAGCSKSITLFEREDSIASLSKTAAAQQAKLNHRVADLPPDAKADLLRLHGYHVWYEAEDLLLNGLETVTVTDADGLHVLSMGKKAFHAPVLLDGDPSGQPFAGHASGFATLDDKTRFALLKRLAVRAPGPTLNATARRTRGA